MRSPTPSLIRVTLAATFGKPTESASQCRALAPRSRGRALGGPGDREVRGVITSLGRASNWVPAYIEPGCSPRVPGDGLAPDYPRARKCPRVAFALRRRPV